MTKQYIDMTKGLHDLLFKFCKESGLYRVQRPELDSLVDLLSSSLENMKLEEKKYEKDHRNDEARDDGV